MGDDIEKFENYEILEDYYVIEAILDKKRLKGIWKYKVKWEGYPMDQCTWEPRENLLNCKELLEKFEIERNKNSESLKNPDKAPINKKEEVESTKIIESKINPVSKNKIILADEDVEMKAPIKGSFETDQGEKIIDARIIDDINIELNCLISWEKRNDGTQAESTWISSNIIRKKDPELLLRYYEKKIKFPVFNHESYLNNNKMC